jgi:hypothetical protein
MRAFSALVIAMATLLMAGSASGLSCPQRDPRDLARAVQVVVTGVVEAESMFGARVRLDRVYLGRAEQTITVLPGTGNANYVGVPWTFYLRRDAVAYHNTTACGGSHPSSLTPEERAFFGAGSAPAPDQQLFGPTGNTVAGVGALAAILLLMTRRRGRRPPLTPAGAHP